MKTDTIICKVTLSDVDKELAKAVHDARYALAAAEAAIVDAYKKSADYRALAAMATTGPYGEKIWPRPRVEGHRIVSLVSVEKDEAPQPRRVNADPKTLNILLTGNLLTDVEKRQLLKDMGIELSDDEAAE